MSMNDRWLLVCIFISIIALAILTIQMSGEIGSILRTLALMRDTLDEIHLKNKKEEGEKNE